MATTKRVIIFDDDEDILSISTYILEEEGWEVVCFTDCNNVVERVKSVNPTIILMDNWIPEDGGIKATQALKNTEDLADIPVIYFSANSEIEKLAAQAGADYYLAKPFDITDLVKVAEQAARA